MGQIHFHRNEMSYHGAVTIPGFISTLEGL